MLAIMFLKKLLDPFVIVMFFRHVLEAYVAFSSVMMAAVIQFMLSSQ